MPDLNAVLGPSNPRPLSLGTPIPARIPSYLTHIAVTFESQDVFSITILGMIHQTKAPKCSTQCLSQYYPYVAVHMYVSN